MVLTRHAEASNEQEAHAAVDGGARPHTRSSRPPQQQPRQQQRQRRGLDDDSDPEGSEDERSSDFDVSRSPEGAAAAAAAGRSARAGRSLRDVVKKPPPANVIQTFTRQPTPPRHSSRAQRRQQQREQQRVAERQQRQEDARTQELQQQQHELHAALRAAASSSHLTRHQTRLLRQWAEDTQEVAPAVVEAAAGGDVEAAATLAVTATEVIMRGVPEDVDSSEDQELDSEHGSEDADTSDEAEADDEGEEEDEGDADAAAEAADAAAGGRASRRRSSHARTPAGATEAAGNANTAAAAAGASGGAARGLKGELLKLKQAAAEAEAAERRRRQHEKIREAARLERIARQGWRGSGRHDSLDGGMLLEYSSGDLQDSEEDGGLSSSEEDGVGRRRSKRRRRWAEASEGEGEEEEEEEEDEGRNSKKKYQLRSRERPQPGRHTHGRSSQPARVRARAAEPRRLHSKAARQQQRRRGGFSDLSSDDGDGHLFPGANWSRLLASAAGAAPGPFFVPSAAPLTPAAAAAAAGGLLSPRAALDRRGSALLDAAPGTAHRVAGSGWGHWGPNGAEAAAGDLAAGAGAAAAAAGGTAADKRGAGLGQELITPLQVDPSIDFDQIGGLDQYLSALKEMVFLPLLYPEIFDKFGVNPPRGVLFHGPPGTGKTLVARALAAQASRAAGQKVSFYMRKGADLLSKWVGEAEKQLRLLFEEASKHQPAIIFFDEIDGLAPVRTSKQDQVHNSIVSTLLALMDGLESRGRVVLIGATNRPDALDPALRRPGRFDRELLFPMPDLTARRSILAIHSRHWTPQPPAALLDDLAQRTGGYCGADLRALCAEASLAALRRVYPQIYASDVKLLINPAEVVVTRQDFLTAMKDLTPAAHRATASHAQALNPVIEPCLSQPLKAALSQVQHLFPPAAACMAAAAAAGAAAGGSSAGPAPVLGKGKSSSGSNGSGSNSGGQLLHMARPRLLLVGAPGSGQQQLGAAVLAALEGLPVHCIGLTSLIANSSARCVEEALVSAFTEARRSAPAVIYWPQAHLWWAAAGSGLRCALVALLDDLPPDMPLLLLATAELPASDPAAAAGGVGSSGSRRLPGPLPLPAAAAAGAGTSTQQQQQQQAALEDLGLEPSLAALFPPVGRLSDLQVALRDLQPQLDQGQQAPQQDLALQQQQQELTQPQQDTAEQAWQGSEVLGWVLLERPGPVARRKMFQGLFDAAAAPPVPEDDSTAQQQPAPLPPAPDAAAAAEARRREAEQAAARAAYEEDQAVLRSLRMILRGIVQRALTLKRYRLFAEPPMPDDEEGMQALQLLSCPMDMLTMLYKVDHQHYVTPAAFLADAHLIVRCAEEMYGQSQDAAVIPAPARAAVPVPAAAAAAGAVQAATSAAAAAAVGPSAAASAAAHHQGQQGAIEGDQGQLLLDAPPPAAAVAAAGAAGPSGAQQLEPLLPAVRVSVCKEVSRAMELKDALEQQVYQLVPPELAQACEAIAAKGGPAPAPAGLLLPQQLLANRLAAPAAPCSADAANRPSRATGSSRRLAGAPLDRRLLHTDPEAIMRAHKQSRVRAAAAQQQQQQAAAAQEAATGANAEDGDATAAEHGEQQGQQPEQDRHEQPAQQAAGDADVQHTAADAGAAEAADMADAAADAAASAGDPEAVLQQELCNEDGSPAALKPVTNGVSRKRRASSAEVAAECGSSRAAKAGRVSAPAQLPVPAIAPGATMQDTPLQQQQQPEHQQQQQLLQLQPSNGQQMQPQQLQGRQQLHAVGAERLSAPTQPLQATTANLQLAKQLLEQVVAASAGMQLSGLELLHARLSRVLAAHAQQQDRSLVLQQLGAVVEGLQRPAQQLQEV